jgi:A/G-specific adenine glycosylase
VSEFSALIIPWQRRKGRRDLPWQNTRNPYFIWLSEVMLQQTQVATVIPYFLRFVDKFPDIAHLAAADEDSVMASWAGLGYYARARNLHRAARLIVSEHGSRFPQDIDAIASLPGIGRSTAGAIAAFAFGQRHPILDGNVKRVLARAFAVPGYPGNARVASELWQLAESLLPDAAIEPYTQGLMDLGAGICTRLRPLCGACPLAAICRALAAGKVQDYPQPKPRREVPVRQVQMLAVFRGGRLLLEKRPETGVWAGLWSLPEVPPEQSPVETLNSRWGIDARILSRLPEIRHAFTHYRLLIRPVCLEAEREVVPPDTRVVWLDAGEALQAAIPTPVRKLLQSLGQFAMNDANGILGAQGLG